MQLHTLIALPFTLAIRMCMHTYLCQVIDMDHQYHPTLCIGKMHCHCAWKYQQRVENECGQQDALQMVRQRYNRQCLTPAKQQANNSCLSNVLHWLLTPLKWRYITYQWLHKQQIHTGKAVHIPASPLRYCQEPILPLSVLVMAMARTSSQFGKSASATCREHKSRLYRYKISFSCI